MMELDDLNRYLVSLQAETQAEIQQLFGLSAYELVAIQPEAIDELDQVNWTAIIRGTEVD